MFDVFTEEIEILIKDGIANLYWYRGDLNKAWYRVGVPEALCKSVYQLKDEVGAPLSKRRQMDKLYEHLRGADFNLRLRISRGFVRTLIEHKNFVPQEERHRIEFAERAALKLRELIAAQENEKEQKERTKREAASARIPTYHEQLAQVRDSFEQARKWSRDQGAMPLKKYSPTLCASAGYKSRSHFRIRASRWTAPSSTTATTTSLNLNGSLTSWSQSTLAPSTSRSMAKWARGIVIAINGYTDGVLETLPKGKGLKVLLLDGNHFANVIYGLYRFDELMDHSIRCASLNGQLYCPHQLPKGT